MASKGTKATNTSTAYKPSATLLNAGTNNNQTDASFANLSTFTAGA